jgi:hypothetical protein
MRRSSSHHHQYFLYPESDRELPGHTGVPDVYRVEGTAENPDFQFDIQDLRSKIQNKGVVLSWILDIGFSFT